MVSPESVMNDKFQQFPGVPAVPGTGAPVHEFPVPFLIREPEREPQPEPVDAAGIPTEVEAARADTLPSSRPETQTDSWSQPFMAAVVEILASAVLADLRLFSDGLNATDETPRGTNRAA